MVKVWWETLHGSRWQFNELCSGERRLNVGEDSALLIEAQVWFCCERRDPGVLTVNDMTRHATCEHINEPARTITFKTLQSLSRTYACW